IKDLTRKAQAPAISRAQSGPTAQASRKVTAVKPGPKPEQGKIDAAMRPTRNGIRSLFERAAHIMEMDQEDVEKLLAELEKNGRIRSPVAGISLMAAYARLAELDPGGAMDRAMK